MADFAALKAAATEVHRELVDAYLRAQTQFDRLTTSRLYSGFSWGTTYVDQGTYDGIESELENAGVYLDKLAPAGSITARLLSGEMTWERWLSEAKGCRFSIDSALKDVGAEQNVWGRFWDEVVDQSVTDIKKKVLEPTFDLVPWIAAAAVALSVAYVVFAFRGVRG